MSKKKSKGLSRAEQSRIAAVYEDFACAPVTASEEIKKAIELNRLRMGRYGPDAYTMKIDWLLHEALIWIERTKAQVMDITEYPEKWRR